MEQYINEFSIITQNVDGLHTVAGNRQVIELHGSLWVLRCITCDHEWEDLQVQLPQLPPRCPSCHSIARPGVVWFGEMLDSIILEEAHRLTTLARTMLVVGTSALVQPASLLPLIALNAGAHVIEFNIEPTTLTPNIDKSIFGPATQTLPAWWNQILKNLEG